MRDEVNLSHLDKHQSFPQVDTTIFGGYGQASLDSLSNCGIRRMEMSQKEIEGLPYHCLTIIKAFS